MEGNKKKASSSSSSFTSDLFGPTESSSSSSSSGFFGSIFSPSSSKVFGNDSTCYEPRGKDYANQVWGTKHGGQDNTRWKNECENRSVANRDKSPYYQEQHRVPPCHLSSSLYYGGQDVYSQPQNKDGSGQSTYKKDGEDDSGSPHRGNWWQGSFYY